MAAGSGIRRYVLRDSVFLEVVAWYSIQAEVCPSHDEVKNPWSGFSVGRIGQATCSTRWGLKGTSPSHAYTLSSNSSTDTVGSGSSVMPGG
jgi:hypothetical protein